MGRKYDSRRCRSKLGFGQGGLALGFRNLSYPKLNWGKAAKAFSGFLKPSQCVYTSILVAKSSVKHVTFVGNLRNWEGAVSWRTVLLGKIFESRTHRKISTQM